MKKNISYKVSSAIMCAAMAGTTVATPIMSIASATTDGFGQEVMQDDVTGQVPTDISVVIDSSTAAVTFDGTQTLESFVKKLLAMTGVEMVEDSVRMDVVEANGFRTSIRTGNAETDAGHEIQTMGDYCEFVKAQGRAVTLVVFTDAHDIARIVISELEDGSMFVDVEKDTPEVSYRVCYDANGGQLSGTDFVLRAKGELLSYIETTASYDRHAFDGWYDAKVGGNKVDENTVITEDMILYAHWIADTYRIDFDTQGGNVIESMMVSVDESVYDLPVPEREGYTFLGWYSEADGGTKVISVETPEDTVLYAHWEENVTTPVKPDTDDTETEIPDVDDSISDDETIGDTETEIPDDDSNDDMSDETETPESTTYKLVVTTSNGSSVNVSVKSDVKLNTLVHELGYTDAESYVVRKVDGSEVTVTGDDSVYSVATLADEGDIVLVAFDANNTELGSAKITKNEATGEYVVTLLDDEADDEADDTTTVPDDENNGGSEDDATVTPDDGSDDVTIPDDSVTVPDSGDTDDTTTDNDDNNMVTTPDTDAVVDDTTTDTTVSDTTTDTTQETDVQVVTYKLDITNSDGSSMNVAVKSTVQLGTLVTKLGYTNAVYFSVKTTSGSETKVKSDVTMQELAAMADAGNILLIVYDASGQPIGSAKIVSVGDGEYQISLSKDTNVDLTSATTTTDDALKGADISDESGVSGKGKGEGEDSTANPVKTADMSVMPVFGVMGSITTALLGVFAAIKRRLL